MCAGICRIYLQYNKTYITTWFSITMYDNTIQFISILFLYVIISWIFIHMCIYIYVYWIGSGEYPFYQLQVELFSPRFTRNVPGILLVDAEHWISGWNLWGSNDSLRDIGDLCWIESLIGILCVWEAHCLQRFFLKCVARYLARFKKKHQYARSILVVLLS